MSLLFENLERSARDHGSNEAFVCGNESIRYQELLELSERFAGVLREHGIGAGDRIAIRMLPSIQSAIAVYGAWKAGCTFLPIDPQAPDARVISILGCSRARVLCGDPLGKSLSDAMCHGATDLAVTIGEAKFGGCPSVDWKRVSEFRRCKSGPDGSSDAPAYIIFTSGSTGTPKGIVHTHASGEAYARLSQDAYDVVPEDRIGNLSPLHFDMSTFGYLTSVRAGATAVLIPPSYAMLPASLSQLIQDQRLSVWYSVPFALIQLLERGVLGQRDCRSLRWVLFGGEPIAPDVVNRLREAWPSASFSNVYGPAEVNQCTRFDLPAWRKVPNALHEESSIPIGTTWDQTVSRIVDENGEVCEPGTPGELLIHSTTMMQSYLGKTPEDPSTFWVEPSSNRRFYRTADRVCQDKDGNLVFLGRRDRMVKLRGYRIELDEIEHTLEQHGSVAEAAVICAGEKIVAFVLCASDSEFNETELRRHLQFCLPPYALPEKVTKLRTFPRTTSGKIDRRRLADSIHGTGSAPLSEGKATCHR